MNHLHTLSITERAKTQVARLTTHGCEDRDALHRATVRYLIDKCSCTLLNARVHAAKAVAEHAAKGLTARIDCAKTTSTCVFVNLNGELRALALPDLMHALEHPGQTH